MTEFVSVIVDECGEVVRYCRDWTAEEIREVLACHPEWRKGYICVCCE